MSPRLFFHDIWLYRYVFSYIVGAKFLFASSDNIRIHHVILIIVRSRSVYPDQRTIKEIIDQEAMPKALLTRVANVSMVIKFLARDDTHGIERC